MGFYVYLLSLFNRNQDKPTSSFMVSPSPSGICKVNSCPSASVISRFLSSFASLLSNWTMCLSISPLLRVLPTFFIVLVRRRRCFSETCSLGFWAWGTRWMTMGWKKHPLLAYVIGIKPWQRKREHLIAKWDIWEKVRGQSSDSRESITWTDHTFPGPVSRAVPPSLESFIKSLTAAVLSLATSFDSMPCWISAKAPSRVRWGAGVTGWGFGAEAGWVGFTLSATSGASQTWFKQCWYCNSRLHALQRTACW